MRQKNIQELTRKGLICCPLFSAKFASYSPQGRLVPFCFCVEKLSLASPDAHTFCYLSGEAVSEAVHNLCLEIRLHSIVSVCLVFVHEGFFFSLVIVSGVLPSSCVEVPGSFSNINCSSVLRA